MYVHGQNITGTCQENQTLTFEFMEKLGLEMLARVGLYGADLDFRGYSVSQRACEGLWASCHPMK